MIGTGGAAGAPAGLVGGRDRGDGGDPFRERARHDQRDVAAGRESRGVDPGGVDAHRGPQFVEHG